MFYHILGPIGENAFFFVFGSHRSSDYLGAWTGSGILIASNNAAWGGLAAPNGYHYYGEQGDGWISQSVPTDSTATYVLNFYAAARPGYGMETLNV